MQPANPPVRPAGAARPWGELVAAAVELAELAAAATDVLLFVLCTLEPNVTS